MAREVYASCGIRAYWCGHAPADGGNPDGAIFVREDGRLYAFLTDAMQAGRPHRAGHTADRRAIAEQYERGDGPNMVSGRY